MNEVPQAVEAALIGGDLSKLTSEQRVVYYNRVCESVGLNPLTKPFEYITLNGKLTLYARRDCTDQLRKIHRVSVTIKSREKSDDVYIVTAVATMPDGRTDEAIGAVAMGAGKGEALANALMKAETKAKRRVTLSICGLGWLDETEIEDHPKQDRAHGDATPMIDVATQIKQLAEQGKTYEYDLADCEENTKKLIVGIMKKDGFYASQETRTYHTAKPIALENAKNYLVNMPAEEEVAA
jgi:hypothetical protein